MTEQQQTERSILIPEYADPVKFAKLFWPHYTIYDKQREILYSLRDNYETIAVAGNKLGKDFITALGILWFFSSRRPARVTATSPNAPQLDKILWGEIRRHVESAVHPLPIEIMGDMTMYQRDKFKKRVPLCEVEGKVTQKGEAVLGKHADRTAKGEPTTLFVVDEASGCDDTSYDMADTWAHRILIIGNPFPCVNFFFKGVEEGDKEGLPETKHLYNMQRKVIKITAEDSPNVQLGRAEEAAGLPISHEIIIPGLLTYAELLQREEQWDEIKKTVSLKAEFYKGREVMMYPPDWLSVAFKNHRKIKAGSRVALGIGVDTAEGGDSTVWAASDELGLIRTMPMKTPDTSVIPNRTLVFMRMMGLDPDNKMDCGKVIFDTGGGGKQHADVLRAAGYPVRTVGFGEAATRANEPKPGTKTKDETKKEKDISYECRNKRAEIALRLRKRLDPSIKETQFAISPRENKLLEQLRPIPLTYDEEGRYKLPPKRKRSEKDTGPTLTQIIGYSPDEFDAVGLSVYAMEVPAPIAMVSSIIKGRIHGGQ